MGYVVVVGIGGRRVFDQRDIQATGIYRCVGMWRVWGGARGGRVGGGCAGRTGGVGSIGPAEVSGL